MPGALPNLLVIGTMKCGTSSLHYYLGLHPEIQMSRPKELHFFLDRELFDPTPFIDDPREARLFGEPGTWRQGIDWYRGFFSPAAKVRGESTVAYTYPWFRGVAQRMASVVPDARLIYLTRAPIDRIASHYLMYRQGGREWRSLSEALGRPRNCYVAATEYASNLRPFLDEFGRDRVHVVRQDELLDRRRETLQEVFRFLEVDDAFWSPEMEVRRNRSAVKGRAYRAAIRVRRSRMGKPIRRLPPKLKARVERAISAPSGAAKQPALEARLRAQVLDQLEPDIADLEALTGWDLEGWRR